MYYITVGELIKHLQELPKDLEIKLPKDLEINSVGTDYHSSRYYLAISDLHSNALKEIELNRRDNDAC